MSALSPRRTTRLGRHLGQRASRSHSNIGSRPGRSLPQPTTGTGRSPSWLSTASWLLAIALSSCSLPDEYLAGGKDAHIRRAEIPVTVAPAEPPLAATASEPAIPETITDTPPDQPAYISNAGDLEMSDEIIPFDKFARGREEQYRMVTERIDDAVFAQNRERRRLIERRSLDDSVTDLPDRRSFFGGDRFLSPGPVDPGWKLPTGATWRPMFFAFGTLRSAVQLFDQGPTDVTEWANRLDLYGELALSGTERVLVGVRPLDYKGAFSGYTVGGGSKKEGWVDELNLVPQTLFFEGDFGELFPCLDPHDKHRLDYQFSIGRQPMLLQDGLMVNDTIDGIAVTRHNIYMLGASNTRLSGWFGLNEVNRGNMMEDKTARLYALSSTFDYAERTLEADAAYISSDLGDGAYVGIGHIQRFGHWGSTLRANASWALDHESPAVGTGYLFTHELSRTMPGNSDIVYLNTYLGLDNYTSAARGPATGGPLGRLGLMNRSVGLGSYGAPLSNKSGDVVGASLGYQHFFDALAYKQLLVELGGRTPYGQNAEKTIGALGAQYQWGFGRGLIFILGGFGSLDEDGQTGYGARSELLVKF